MRGFELVDRLHTDFRVTGTAGREVFARDTETGTVYSVVDVEREEHEDGSVTHWIKVEEF